MGASVSYHNIGFGLVSDKTENGEEKFQKKLKILLPADIDFFGIPKNLRFTKEKGKRANAHFPSGICFL